MPDGTPIGRRVILGMAGLGAAWILFGSRAQAVIERVMQPVILHDPTGLSSLLPTAGQFRIYSVTGNLPSRSAADYRLTVDGLVQRPRTYTLADLRAAPPTLLTRAFQCVTGWRVPDVPWVGVALAHLLDEAGPSATATHLRLHSFDGTYTESLSLDQARRPDVLVAYELQGKPIGHAHGGPARLYVAPMYGYKSLKWLDRIEVVDRLVPGYWEQEGYDVDGWVGHSNGRDDSPTG